MYRWVSMSHENNQEDMFGKLHGDSESLSFDYIFIVLFLVSLSFSFNIIQSHNGSFTLEDNHVNFSFRQKVVAWLPMVLFTLDVFLSCRLVRAVHYT